jgi:CxxC motif-containing protein (DUF1111 family)
MCKGSAIRLCHPKSAARAFGFAAVFLLLTIDTIRRVPVQTKQQHLTEQVVHGKQLWERNNCMGCHTLLGRVDEFTI